MPRALGIGALVAGGIAFAFWLLVVAIFIAPFFVWLAWNVLDFGPAVGLPELGFWAIVLLAIFLAVGWFWKVAITAIVFLSHPGWLDAQAQLRWPEPTFRNFVAVALLACVAARPHARSEKRGKEAS